MKKVLVLENINEVDQKLAAYLNKKDEWELDIVKGLVHTGITPEIIEKIKTSDIICTCSSFADMTQFENFVDLFVQLHATTGKKFDIRILYLYEMFPAFLSEDIDKSYFKKIVKLMEDGVKITNILVEVKEKREPRDSATFFPKKYFATLLYFFDEVELYYNEKIDCIWYIRKPDVRLPQDDYCMLSTTYVPKHYQPSKLEGLTKKELGLLKDILREYDSIVEVRSEDLTYNNEVQQLFSFEERAELLNIHDTQRTFIDKILPLLK